MAKTKFDPLAVELPDWLSYALWVEWVEYRKALRKPIKTPQGAKGSIRELERYRSYRNPPLSGFLLLALGIIFGESVSHYHDIFFTIS